MEIDALQLKSQAKLGKQRRSQAQLGNENEQ
jgi:hypothetical protein